MQGKRHAGVVLHDAFGFWGKGLLNFCGICNIATSERGDSLRGGEMPAGQRGLLSTRGISEAGGGVPP